MSRLKALVYSIAALIAFFLAGFVTGYTSRLVISKLGIDTDSGFGSAVATAIGSVVGYLYRRFVIGIFKRAVKAIVSRNRLFYGEEEEEVG